MTRSCLRLPALALALALTLPAAAQDSPAFDHRAILAAAERVQITIGAAAEEARGQPWPLHFTIEVPNLPGRMQVQASNREPARMLAVLFRTPEGEVAERVDIIPAAVNPCPREIRREGVSLMLRDEILPLLGPLTDFELRGIIPSAIRDEMEAVELLGLYRDDAGHTMMLRIVAIFPPIGRDIVVAISRIALNHVQLGHFNELPGTISFDMLESIAFTHRRNNAGDLLPMIGQGRCED